MKYSKCLEMFDLHVYANLMFDHKLKSTKADIQYLKWIVTINFSCLNECVYWSVFQKVDHLPGFDLAAQYRLACSLIIIKDFKI